MLLKVFSEVGGQVIAGPMGMPISLNFVNVDLYLQNAGISNPYIRNWVFRKVNFIFSLNAETLMNNS